MDEGGIVLAPRLQHGGLPCATHFRARRRADLIIRVAAAPVSAVVAFAAGHAQGHAHGGAHAHATAIRGALLF
eukprot:351375-Chlamydomonas_euryale.AAC.25